jgi:hypothetical protein
MEGRGREARIVQLDEHRGGRGIGTHCACTREDHLQAVEVFASEKNKKLFSEFKIFTPQETTARQVQLMNVYDAWTLFFGMNSVDRK